MSSTVRQLLAWEWTFSVSRFALPFRGMGISEAACLQEQEHVSLRAAPFSETLRTCQGDKQNGQRGLPPFPRWNWQVTQFPRPWSLPCVLVNIGTAEHSWWQNVSHPERFKKKCTRIKSSLEIVHKKLSGWKMFGSVNVPYWLIFSYRTSDLAIATQLSSRTESTFSLPSLLEELVNMQKLTV